jgi:hypothetical protein
MTGVWCGTGLERVKKTHQIAGIGMGSGARSAHFFHQRPGGIDPASLIRTCH